MEHKDEWGPTGYSQDKLRTRHRADTSKTRDSLEGRGQVRTGRVNVKNRLEMTVKGSHSRTSRDSDKGQTWAFP